MPRPFEPASRGWEQRFKAQLKGPASKCWKTLRQCYPERHLLDIIHDSCGPVSLIKKIKTLREEEIAQRRELEDATKQLDKTIKALEKLKVILERVKAKPEPTVLGEVVPELRSYFRALENHQGQLESDQASRGGTKALTRNFGLGLLFEAFMSCAGEPPTQSRGMRSHWWLEVSDLINAAYRAHGIMDEYLTSEAAQKIYSRHRQNSRTQYQSARH
jgi:hypothetical protein